MPNLCEIDLSSNKAIIPAEFLYETSNICSLLHSMSLANITDLNQVWNEPVLNLGNNGLANLRTLNLEESLAGPEGIDFIIKSSAFESLAQLNLNNCKLTDNSVRELFLSPLMHTLE